MPKTKLTAAQLIEKRKTNRPGSLEAPSAKALAELRTIVDHNDTCDRAVKVTVEATIELLRDHGWAGRTRQALNSVCVNYLERTSFAQL